MVAIGECGLDYARTQFCAADVQRRFFEAQLALAAETGLPLFLHLRDAEDDFLDIVNRHRAVVARTGGVVHSFDGSPVCLARVLAIDGLRVGLNGCSLRTEENVAVARTIPRDAVLIETGKNERA